MKKIKKAIFLVAENCSGKTTIADLLNKELSAEKYSLREIIKSSAQTEEIELKERKDFISFSQERKKIYGSEVFIKKALDDFIDSSERYAIIESLRCPGEIMWINQNHLYNGIQLIPIAILTPQELRLERFINRSLDENLSTEKTVEEFLRHEKKCNSGSELWEENIKKTIMLTFHRFDNSDGNSKRVAKEITKRIYSI